MIRFRFSTVRHVAKILHVQFISEREQVRNDNRERAVHRYDRSWDVPERRAKVLKDERPPSEVEWVMAVRIRARMRLACRDWTDLSEFREIMS